MSLDTNREWQTTNNLQWYIHMVTLKPQSSFNVLKNWTLVPDIKWPSLPWVEKIWCVDPIKDEIYGQVSRPKPKIQKIKDGNIFRSLVRNTLRR